MKLQEYCDILNLEIECTYHPNQKSRWTANFPSVETKDNKGSSILESTYGNGDSPLNSLNDYVKKIRGKLIVINATGGIERREYEVPINLEL